MLVGHPRHDPRGLDELPGAVADEAGTAAPTDPAVIQDIALTWVASRGPDTQDTRAAVPTLARLAEINLDLNLGHFIGLDDERSGNWGRHLAALKAEADETLTNILNRTRSAVANETQSSATGDVGALADSGRDQTFALKHI